MAALPNTLYGFYGLETAERNNHIQQQAQEAHDADTLTYNNNRRVIYTVAALFTAIVVTPMTLCTYSLLLPVTFTAIVLTTIATALSGAALVALLENYLVISLIASEMMFFETGDSIMAGYIGYQPEVVVLRGDWHPRAEQPRVDEEIPEAL